MSQWFYCVEILEKGKLEKDSGTFPSDGDGSYDTDEGALDAIKWKFRKLHPEAKVTVVTFNKV